jgi:putative transcriptional regulator
MDKLNRIKVILAEKGKSNKWLAAEMDVQDVSVSRWCQNKMQPSLETLYKIATILEVDVCDLLVRETPQE